MRLATSPISQRAACQVVSSASPNTMEHTSKTATFVTVQQSYGEQVLCEEYLHDQVMPNNVHLSASSWPHICMSLRLGGMAGGIHRRGQDPLVWRVFQSGG